MAYSTNNPAGKALQNILDDLPQLLAVAIVDAQSGMVLASHSNSPSFNPGNCCRLQHRSSEAEAESYVGAQAFGRSH